MLAQVTGNLLEIRQQRLLTQGSVGETLEVSFSEEWSGLAVTAIFSAGSLLRDVLVGGDTIPIPWELFQEAAHPLFLNFHGAKADGSIVMRTNIASLGVILPSRAPVGESSEPPSPSLVDQIRASAEEALSVARSVRSDADNGAFNGQDGASPSARVSKSGKITTIEITDHDGTTTATLQDSDVSREEFDQQTRSVSALGSVIDSSIRQSIVFEKNGLSAQGTDVIASNRGRTHGFVETGYRILVFNTIPSVYQINVFWFDRDQALLGQLGKWSEQSSFAITNAAIKYIRIGVKRVDNTTISDEDIESLNNSIYTVCFAKDALMAVETALHTSRTLSDFPNTMDGYLYYIDGVNPPKTISVSYVATRLERVFVPEGTVIAPKGTAQIKVYAFASDGVTPLYSTDRSFFHDGTKFTADQDSYWYINVALYPTANTGDIRTALADVTITYPSGYVGTQISALYNPAIGSNYVIGSDMIKRNIKLQGIGRITYGQAFCKYDGYYYSIDGSHISKQDGSFTPVTAVDLNTGHGNSLQLGSNGKAYVSGWNDQKVYEVDLKTLSVTNIYTLPTTGYTTAAVDDVNKLMYVFQRSTYPDTNTNYTLIVYDYDNNRVLATKKITKAFGGMQAVDFVDGKIFIACGLGSQESPEVVPNRFMMFNTNGDLLAEYSIGTMSNVEAEGIFVDRNTLQVFVSYANRFVYQIS